MARKVKTSGNGECARRLLAWYDGMGRDLPWRVKGRMHPNPYQVWLSEVMLQQTTVAAVIPYFNKFIKRWPGVGDLARAKRDDVLAMWAGLGYYRRAHLLHECAKTVVSDYNGVFPDSEEELLKLPGVGRYTAAAISAIAFGNVANVVDGNVERVMARLFAVQTPLPSAKVELTGLAAGLLPQKRCGDYAQALMDLGATICTPKSPRCSTCPLSALCRGYAEGIAEKLPTRTAKAKRPTKRAIAFIALDGKQRVLLRQRAQGGLLGGMMEVPSSPWQAGKIPTLGDAVSDAPVRAEWSMLPGLVRHVFTHFTLEVRVAVGSARGKVGAGNWTAIDDLDKVALPSVMRKIVLHAVRR